MLQQKKLQPQIEKAFLYFFYSGIFFVTIFLHDLNYTLGGKFDAIGCVITALLL